MSLSSRLRAPGSRSVRVRPRPPATLDERYAAMAHTYEPRPVDAVLRLADVVLSATALIVVAPLALLIALAIALTSGLPVLYRGARVGRAGRVYTMVKFRTLRHDAESRLGPYLGPELTARTAEETTALGRALRATHLDELPQLWNVLRGDMSFVGPRPIRPIFFEQLVEEIPQYWQRLVVRPGLTGLAQLRLEREMTWAEKLAHDLEYIADRSLRLYLVTVLATAGRVFSDPAPGGAGGPRRTG
jgi:lipopolysaccharide/colanic/teichoic acid biosynthesis glycosyltransferase